MSGARSCSASTLPTICEAAATIDLNSIDTNNPTRDDDLRSSNFFEVDKYPTIDYRSTASATPRTASTSTVSSLSMG